MILDAKGFTKIAQTIDQIIRARRFDTEGIEPHDFELGRRKDWQMGKDVPDTPTSYVADKKIAEKLYGIMLGIWDLEESGSYDYDPREGEEWKKEEYEEAYANAVNLEKQIADSDLGHIANPKAVWEELRKVMDVEQLRLKELRVLKKALGIDVVQS